MRKYLFLLFAVTVVTVLFRPIAAQADATAKVTINVIDEEGRPVEDARILICFHGGCRTKEAIEGLTENKGFFSMSAPSPDGMVGGGAKKEGYYSSSFHHAYHPFSKKFGRWEPWDKHITVVLRPIGNPVPMYVRNRFFEIPKNGEEIGFDLMKADWVIPYGQGVVADWIVRIDRRYVSMSDFDAMLTVTFSNKSDGIQLVKEERGYFGEGSWFQLPRLAPETGYKSKLVKKISLTDPRFFPGESDDNNYIFRVRTKLDEEGKIVEAMYGKILGDMNFAALAGENGGIRMHYYLNPDGTRNLEFDPERNLFPKGRGEAQP